MRNANYHSIVHGLQLGTQVLSYSLLLYPILINNIRFHFRIFLVTLPIASIISFGLETLITGLPYPGTFSTTHIT